MEIWFYEPFTSFYDEMEKKRSSVKSDEDGKKRKKGEKKTYGFMNYNHPF